MNTSIKNPKTALIKKALMALTVVLAIGFSAFTNAPKKLATDWYAPLSSTLSPTSPAAQNFANYNSTPLDANPSCDGSIHVCASEFPDTSQPPVNIETRDN